ncbi:hypothetical protein AGMMS50255_1110 [Spirochaetia bacterium]|nr:hypothetical protein AGMMS50255_1110 [Spirochaetia bacterium]
MRKLVFVFILAFLSAHTYAQSPNPFAQDQGSARWQGRISYRDVGGKSHSELYELILVPNGTCIVTISGKQNGTDVFQDADGLWSFDENFFRLECDFPDPAFEHLSTINWVSVYQFDALNTRFTLLIKPYPDAKTNVKVAFNKVDD